MNFKAKYLLFLASNIAVYVVLMHHRGALV